MAVDNIYIDQLNREVFVTNQPQRIISLVPSQTELLFDLDLGDNIVGITKFCVHPRKQCLLKEKIGGTKKLNISKIKSLRPDLIIANKEENDKAQIMALANDYPVWISDISSLSDALNMITQIGLITNKVEKTNKLVSDIKTAFAELNVNRVKRRVAYFIWNNPIMVAGKNTFINNMLELAGFINVFNTRTRYPETDIDQLKKMNPELILLSSEPFPFQSKHVNELQQEFIHAKVVLVDGEMFSWYGSRLIKSAGYFSKLMDALS